MDETTGNGELQDDGVLATLSWGMRSHVGPARVENEDFAGIFAPSVAVVLVLRAAWGLLRASGHVLLEGTPDAVDLDDVRRHITELHEVLSVHDLHACTLTSDLPALSAHVVVTDSCLGDGTVGRVLDHLQDCLANHFDVEHSTFQLEAASHAEHEPGTHD